jgi:hypothetical protein
VSIVAGFMALLKVALMTTPLLGQTPVEAFSGVTESTVGGVVGAVAVPAFPFLSESPHPAPRAASRNAEIQILITFALCISFSCSTADYASFVVFHWLPHVRVFKSFKLCSGTNTHTFRAELHCGNFSLGTQESCSVL